MIITVDETGLKKYRKRSIQSLYKVIPPIKDHRFSDVKVLNNINDVLIKCGKKYYQVFKHTSYPRFKNNKGNYFVNSTTIEEIEVSPDLYTELINVYKSSNGLETVDIYMNGSYYARYFGLKQQPLKEEAKQSRKLSATTKGKEKPDVPKIISPVVEPAQGDAVLIVYVNSAQLQTYETNANNTLMPLKIIIKKGNLPIMPHRFKMLVLTDGDNFFSCGYEAGTNFMVHQKGSHSFNIKINGVLRIKMDFEKYETVFPLTKAPGKSCKIKICKCL